MRKTLLCCLTLICLAAPAFADETPSPPPAKPAAAAAVAAPAADKDGFVPESRPAEMTASVEAGLPAAPLVATAYGFIWAAVLFFVGYTAVRTARLEREITELDRRLESPRAG